LIIILADHDKQTVYALTANTTLMHCIASVINQRQW